MSDNRGGSEGATKGHVAPAEDPGAAPAAGSAFARACGAGAPVQLGMAIVVLYVLLRELHVAPYDDSFFFKRFAMNFLAHGVFAWNPIDGPVYAATSQLMQLLAVVPTWLAPGHYVVASRVMLGLLLLGAMLVAGREASARTRCSCDGALLILLALCAPITLPTLTSGMETALALLLVTLAVRAIEHGGGAHVVALWTLGVYVTRPDAAVIPLVAFLVSHRASPRTLLRYGACLALAVGLTAVTTKVCYGRRSPVGDRVQPRQPALKATSQPSRAFRRQRIEGAWNTSW